MAEETRMSKYKDLRETIDGDADYVPENTEDESDDDFLAFLPKSMTVLHLNHYVMMGLYLKIL